MATLYLDYENGNDNYGGTSFALLASGTNGRISSTTFSAATASFPNDGSLINQYLSIFNGTIYAVYQVTAWVSSTSLTIAAISGGTALANQTVDRQYYIGGRWQTIGNGATNLRINAGDTIRIMGSPAPTSLGVNGTWTSAALAGATNISAATNATPIAVTSTAHGLSTGSTVVVTGVGGNTAANGTWEVTVTGANTFTLNGSAGNGAYTSGGTVRNRVNTRVLLASAVTQTIASTGPRAAWTAVAGGNVTTSLNTTDYKEHQYSDSIAIATGFATGLAAHFATGTLDLSGYQQVSFWIKQTAGTIGAAASISLKLCSDTAGASAVNTVDIPGLGALNRWLPITVDLGTNLGNSIQSIGFYVNTDNGAQTFLLNNIIACKAKSADNSLTLSSLIGKNRSDDTWYGIQSINGTRVMLDHGVNIAPNSATARGYSHSSGTETVTTYKREAIKYPPSTASASAMVASNTTESGTESSPITFSGGWDRTDMSMQTLESWYDGLNGHGYVIYKPSSDYHVYEYIYGVRFNAVFADFRTANNYNNVGASNCGSLFQFFNTPGEFAFNNVKVQGLDAIFQGGPRGSVATVSNFDIYNCVQGFGTSANGLLLTAKTGRIRNCSAAIGMYSSTAYFESVATTDNDFPVSLDTSINIYGKNCIFNEATEFNFANLTYNAIFYGHNHDNTDGNHKIFRSGGLIAADTATRHTSSGFSWKFSPTNINASNSRYPLVLSLAKVAVAANALVTIKAWMYRDNSGLTMRLVCKGGQIAGVPSDVVSTVSATGSWEEETIIFTPTERGAVEVIAEVWGGSTFNGWVDDLTILQA